MPGAAVLAAARVLFQSGHIFHPGGVLAMLGVAAGCGLLATADDDAGEGGRDSTSVSSWPRRPCP